MGAITNEVPCEEKTWTTSLRGTRRSSLATYRADVTSVRRYLIDWSGRSGPGRRGLIGRSSASTPGSRPRWCSSAAAWIEWPPMMSSDGATISTRSGRAAACSRVRIGSVSLARLRRMSTAEIVFRGRQEAFKWLERSPLGGRNGHAPAAGGLDRERFFPGPYDAATAALVLEREPEAAAAVVEWAARARAGSFDLLGYEGLSFGDPLDWQLDPVSGVRAPLVHWSRLDVLDRGQVGDSKVQWELGRHQWLVAFGQAYRLTGDESWCEAFVGVGPRVGGARTRAGGASTGRAAWRWRCG